MTRGPLGIGAPGRRSALPYSIATSLQSAYAVKIQSNGVVARRSIAGALYILTRTIYAFTCEIRRPSPFARSTYESGPGVQRTVHAQANSARFVIPSHDWLRTLLHAHATRHHLVHPTSSVFRVSDSTVRSHCLLVPRRYRSVASVW